MMASPQTPALDAEQTKALFNILTHFETYHEIEDFKKPETVSNYGYPFAQTQNQTQTQTQTQAQTSSRTAATNGVTYAPESSAPLLQSLFTRFVLKLPGVSTLAPEFWNVQVQGILRNFAEADLSESYDKGALGIRKTLATASSTVIETVARGMIGGAPYSDPATRPATYNLESARDLAQAWDDAMHDLVYGDLCDDLLDHLAQTDDFESHSPMTRAANEYIILHLASLAHQVLVISPEGPYLVKLMEQVHKMVPYNMVRQTLKVGNAATMIAGMMKIFLAKLSTVDRISKAKNRPSKGALDAIRAHTESSHADREAIRAQSQSQDRSIIAVMLETANPVLLSDMSGDEHAMCLDFYAALLGMRDREEIISILCKQSPDLLTQAVREAVAGFDPIIRAVHNKVDLSDHLRDAQTFVDQLIATSKPKKAGGRSKDDAESMPTVEDFVQLCKNNKQLLYKWLHAVGKNCPEVMDQFRAWTKDALVAFHKTAKGGESIEDRLGGLFGQVPEKTRAALVPIIDAHAAYLRELDELSLARMQAIVEGGSASMAGPGVYLVRWQSLMDETLITPARPAGPVRQGKDVKSVVPLQGKRASGSSDTSQVVAAVRKMSISSLLEAPDVKPVIRALAPMFKRQLALSSRANGPRVNGSIHEE
ncbi:hypothetical protein CSHISOI_11202, partial [Colletotrichum shisoi]